MVYKIDEKICEQYDLTLDELIVLLGYVINLDYGATVESLVNKNWLVDNNTKTRFVINPEYYDNISNVLLDSDDTIPKKSSLEDLAKSLMELYPKGKKPGTNQYFRGNTKDIILRLRKFFKMYDKYDDATIIDATKRYVESFNGSYEYMRLLKYFIWKDEKKLNSDGGYYVEEVSDLASFIENKEDSSIDNNWMNELV